VYVVSVLGSLSVFGRNPTTGTATFLEVHREGVAGVDGLLGAHSVEVSPDGEHVYVAAGYPDGFAGFAADDKVSMFQRNALTGSLSYLGVKANGDPDGTIGLYGVTAIRVSPDGTYAYAVSLEAPATV